MNKGSWYIEDMPADKSQRTSNDVVLVDAMFGVVPHKCCLYGCVAHLCLGLGMRVLCVVCLGFGLDLGLCASHGDATHLFYCVAYVLVL